MFMGHEHLFERYLIVKNFVGLMNCYFNLHYRVANIGVWFNVLYCMMVLSMLTNSLIVGFSSEQLAVWCPWMYETIDNDQFIINGYGRYAVVGTIKNVLCEYYVVGEKKECIEITFLTLKYSVDSFSWVK